MLLKVLYTSNQFMSLHYFNYFNSSNFNNSKLFSDLYLTKFLDKNF